jgi:hypothetical protein
MTEDLKGKDAKENRSFKGCGSCTEGLFSAADKAWYITEPTDTSTAEWRTWHAKIMDVSLIGQNAPLSNCPKRCKGAVQ